MAPRPSCAGLYLGLGAGLLGSVGCGTPSQKATAIAPPVVATSWTPLHTAAVSYGTIATDAAPLSLTTEDGNGLLLARLDAQVVIEGPLAFTELRLRFINPDERVREGRFQITLPTGAAVNRFAMKGADGRWMEAEMVERSLARRAYDDFLHRRTDPALLEKQAGNQFAARVFPIPASADKELIVSYAQELGDGPFVLPLRGLPAIGQIDARARVLRADRGAPAWEETTLHQAGWQPDRDFAVAAGGRPPAVASGDLVAMRITPALGAGAAPIHAATILVDDSASRALGWDHAVDDVGAMIRALARTQGDPRITVAAFDQEIAPIYEGPASGWSTAETTRLRQRGALGASDLGAALTWAAGHGARDRVVVVTDGVATAGDSDPVGLGHALGALAPAVTRVDVVLAGGIRDESTAKVLSHGLAQTGAVLDLARGPDEVARRLGLATRGQVAIAVEGAAWTWPDHLDGLQPGDGATIYAQLDKSAAARATLAVDVDGHAVTVTPAAVPRALVERAAAAAQVQSMEARAAATRDPAARAALTEQIVALSIQERVISDATALLVLESDADYARYGLDRKALADILIVGKDGLELSHRDAPAVIAAPPTVDEQTATKGGEKQKLKELEKATADKTAAVRNEVRDDDAADGLVLAKKPAPGRDDIDLAGGPAPRPAPEEERPRPDLVPAPPPPPPPSPAPASVGSRIAIDGDARPAGAAVYRGQGSGGGGAGEGGAAGSGRAAVAAVAPDPAERAAAPRDHAMRLEAGPAPQIATELDGTTVEVDDDLRDTQPPWSGPYQLLQADLAAGRNDAALDRARAWHDENPGDVLALVGLGDALEARGDLAGAARAYGSIIDLFPGRADLRRFAGERLEHVADRADGAAVARALALDTYRRAVEDRPDHLNAHRLYAYALLRAGRAADALAAIERGIDQGNPSGRFRGVDRILREDLGLIGSAWAQAEPGEKAAIAARIARRGGALFEGETTRFILNWETDDNDVDFHIRDAHGGHAFYQRMHLRSGGDLYADVTTGYGPEEFALDGKATAGPYHVQIHYFSRGPMGYGMGTLEILHRDRGGALRFEHRPFIVMNDKAYVDLGTVK